MKINYGNAALVLVAGLGGYALGHFLGWWGMPFCIVWGYLVAKYWEDVTHLKITEDEN